MECAWRRVTLLYICYHRAVQVVEYEQKLQHMNTLTAQFNEARDRYRQMKQHAAESDQRASQAEAKLQEVGACVMVIQRVVQWP
jgi:hypothetical protein